MGLPALTWVPTGETTTQTASFPRQLQRFTGLRNEAAAVNVGPSGSTCAVFHDAWAEYDVELRAINRNSSAAFWAALTSWWSHAAAGGEFAFAIDADNTLDTTTSAACTAGDTTFSVASTATLATSDWVLIEDAADASRWELRQVSQIAAAVLTVNTGLSRGYPAGTIVRHAEYFPACVCLQRESPLRERDAGNGVGWDLAFRFRTVR